MPSRCSGVHWRFSTIGRLRIELRENVGGFHLRQREISVDAGIEPAHRAVAACRARRLIAKPVGLDGDVTIEEFVAEAREGILDVIEQGGEAGVVSNVTR